tara:strand:+ start:76 stop:507 length:432 start_codon:yes stop_codon:yes gene_type:complete
MNRVVWAEMQSQEVLAAVDMMIPGMVSEEEFVERYSVRHSHDFSHRGKSYGKEKVVAGVSLIAVGVSQLVMPGNAMAAAAIQRAFQLGGAYVGSFFGPAGSMVGFAVGTVVGGAVAAVWVYGVPIIQIASGAYLVVTGLIEMM